MEKEFNRGIKESMSRSDRHINKKKPFYQVFSFFLASFVVIGLISFHIYLKNTIKVETPKKELGKKVVVEMPNGKDIYTYENLIVSEDGKLIYKGERNTLDLTGGKIKYKQWK